MEQQELIPHLFRIEYRKIVAVLSKLFGLEHIEIAEDIASDTFLSASELWGLKGLPENPVAWLYTVAKNKAKNYLKHNAVFNEKIARQLRQAIPEDVHVEIDLSPQNITDSQLQMMFAVCHPSIPAEAQVGLALRILCGFGIDEIASAFLTSKETIKKRLLRAKEKLRAEQIKIEFPGEAEMNKRLEPVLTTLYLLFNEGYYSSSQDVTLRKDLCIEAMRLTGLLLEHGHTAKPQVYALMGLMCFQSSRFEARIDANGDTILYDDQDTNLWNQELIERGRHFFYLSSQGDIVSKYHLEAGIAWWHTQKEDTTEKWEHILQLYNRLLQVEYSPMAALSRTYALSKARNKTDAIAEAEKLDLADNHLYHSLLGGLYIDVDNDKAIVHLKKALRLAKSTADKTVVQHKINQLMNK
jgi:RNA polymerase sigma factor (sigma-70 family)